MATAKKKTVTVLMTGSITKQSPSVKATLVGLGLKKPRSVNELEDTSSVRGMIKKVQHLVEVVGE